MVETVDNLANKFGFIVSNRLRNESMQIGSSVYKEMPVLLKGATDLLIQAEKKYNLLLITRGHKTIQEKKISYHGLSRYFSQIFIVKSKSEKVYEKVMAMAGVTAADCCSIGDSVKSDILPCLALGTKAILFQYVHPYYTWTQEHSIKIEYPPFPVVNNLEEIMQKLELLEQVFIPPVPPFSDNNFVPRN